MANPIDEFLSELPETTKEADFRQDFGKAMVGGLGAAAATGAIGIGAMGARALYNAATATRDFRQMLAHNEDLKDHHAQDPRRFNQLYSSLRTMNPAFAKDPIVAGTYMRQMIESPMNAGGILAQTVSHRDKFPSIIDRSADDAMSVARSRFSPKKGGGDGGDAPAQG